MTEAVNSRNFKVTFQEEGVDWNEYQDHLESFSKIFEPLERENYTLLKDGVNNAVYIECHISAEKIINNGTINVPLDEENSAEYKANRDIVSDHSAYERMSSDAHGGRRFSNIVAEYIPGDKPLKIIGGQHRFKAIEEALDSGINTEHGVKVYFELDKEQRLDVQIISNTNISVSKELLDRMYETISGSELRDWAQKCDLLEDGQDFADTNSRNNPLTVKEIRNFIINYYLGKNIDNTNFANVDTTPQIIASGIRDPKLWVDTKTKNTNWTNDENLLDAGRNFSKLMKAQLEFFYDKNKKKFTGSPDARFKAKNIALMAAWSFVAGALQNNKIRLSRHYSLCESTKTKDPLRADLLAAGRHSTDQANYRGLGMRSDAKERGRFVELFWHQAENGKGISKSSIDLAIQEYEAKQAVLRAKAMREKIK